MVFLFYQKRALFLYDSKHLPCAGPAGATQAAAAYLFHCTVSSDIGLPPSTVHRLLQTLCEKGFVYRDEQTHLYQLGPALISLGTAAAQGQDLRQLATPVLQRLAQQALEDAFLIIPFRLSRVGSLPGGRPQQSARDREVRL